MGYYERDSINFQREREDGRFFFMAVDKNKHFVGFVEADNKNTAKSMIKDLGYRIYGGRIRYGGK